MDKRIKPKRIQYVTYYYEWLEKYLFSLDEIKRFKDFPITEISKMLGYKRRVSPKTLLEDLGPYYEAELKIEEEKRDNLIKERNRIAKVIQGEWESEVKTKQEEIKKKVKTGKLKPGVYWITPGRIEHG